MASIETKKNYAGSQILGILLICSLLVLLFTPFFGAETLSLSDVIGFTQSNVDAKIYWLMRLPRAMVSFLAGTAFALSGMVFQAIFRNPLVCPFTLGVSGGASLGAALYIWLGLSFSILGISGISFFSFLGALFSILMVWGLAKMQEGRSTEKILLAGITVSFFFVSLIMFLQYLSGPGQSMKISRWLMGGLFVFGYDALRDLFPFVIAGSAAILYFSQDLNLLTTGEETAMSRGVDVLRVIKILFFLISAMVGGVVAVCGPIAFVGIIVPHICRLLIGPDHRYLTPATFLFGGIFLTVCDTFARILAPPTEIPVGVITALLGGPFFLWLLCRNRF